MPKNTGTMHHCPGANGWVGDASPGGCDIGWFRVPETGEQLHYCKKHSMPCRNGCEGWYHLKNQDGCLQCETTQRAKARRERAAKEKAKEDEKKKVDDAFWNPDKERKKPKKPKKE